MSKSRSRSRSKNSPKHARSTSDRTPSEESDAEPKHHSSSSKHVSNRSPSAHSDRASNHHHHSSDHSDHTAHSHSEDAAPSNVRLGKMLNRLDCRRCGRKCNITYVFTLSGLVQCICWILELIGFICVQLSGKSEMLIAIFFSIAVCINMFFSAIVLLLHMFDVYTLCGNFGWISVEFYFYITAASLTLMTSALITARHIPLYTFAAFCGYAAMIGHCFNAFLTARQLRKQADSDQYSSESSSSDEDRP